MGFQLTIAEGKEAGREFVFEQSSVTIGRSSDCDVVLYDAGVSRRHARIFAEGEDFCVEDLGSSNGTKLNGQLVKKQQLSDGDAVSLGPVVFNFIGTLLPEAPAADPQVADQSTRIVSAGSVKRSRDKGEALVPGDANAEELNKLRRTTTKAMPAATRPRASNPRLAQRPSSSALAAPARPSRAPPEDGARLSAAERARIRREAPGALGSFRIFWREASPAARRAVWTVAGAVVLGLVGALYYLVLSQHGGAATRGPEPDVLSRRAIEQSFGLGAGVDHERPDMKVFEFEYLSPTRALVILYYQARDISQGEVSIVANGRELGSVPPDTLASGDRLLDVVIPPEVLKRGELNQIIFDNTQNPPGRESWRVWNLRIEPVPLPEVGVDQLLREAKASFDRAARNSDRKDVGAANRYEAWKDYRNAWLLMEGHPEPRPEIHDIARVKMREAQQELDRTCARLMLEAEKYYNQKDWDRALSTLEHVTQYFPNPSDQLCPRRAEQKRDQYGL